MSASVTYPAFGNEDVNFPKTGIMAPNDLTAKLATAHTERSKTRPQPATRLNGFKGTYWLSPNHFFRRLMWHRALLDYVDEFQRPYELQEFVCAS